ncbi:hypothetical protein V1478_005013 [Vespula squamosa]|uniref:Uncharacterized protein n=1 Tax=Vespula squamosa TaxID=30214 RepID=A0ABD2BFE5_VESSQ
MLTRNHCPILCITIFILNYIQKFLSPCTRDRYHLSSLYNICICVDAIAHNGDNFSLLHFHTRYERKVLNNLKQFLTINTERKEDRITCNMITEKFYNYICNFLKLSKIQIILDIEYER